MILSKNHTSRSDKKTIVYEILIVTLGLGCTDTQEYGIRTPSNHSTVEIPEIILMSSFSMAK